MADSEITQSGFQLNTGQVVAGSILIGIGGVIALAGVATAGMALVKAYRDRVAQMDMPPSALAKHHWDRFRAAAVAGVGEYRNGRQPAEATSH